MIQRGSRVRPRRRRRRLKKHYRILLGLTLGLAAVGLLGLLIRAAAASRTREDRPEGAVDKAAAELAEDAAAEAPEDAEAIETSGIPGPFALRAGPDTHPPREELHSEFAVLVDADSGEILVDQGAGMPMYPASMTKVLTLLVAAELMPEPEGTFTMTRQIADYCFTNRCSVVGYEVGEEVPVEELFYGCILCSGADASLALAQLSAGTHEAFVEHMNEKAAELDLSAEAHFTNCVGVFDPAHRCTAEDMALILRAALENERCRTVLGTPFCTSEPTKEHPEGQVLSNWFLRRMEAQDTGGVTVRGGKTGYVPESGNCAASCGTDASGRRLICVTGKAGSTWQTIYDHAQLYREL